MDGWVGRWVSRWVDRWVDGWMDDGLMDGWMDGWKDGWMDEQTDQSVNKFPHFQGPIRQAAPVFQLLNKCTILSLRSRHSSVLMISMVGIDRKRAPCFTDATCGKLFAKCTIYHLKTTLPDILSHL